MKKLLPHYKKISSYIKTKNTETKKRAIESYEALKDLYEKGKIGVTARKRVDTIFKNFTLPAGYNTIKW